MRNDYSKITNEDLIAMLNNSIKETKLIFKEIMNREDSGRLKRKYDEIDKMIFEQCSIKKKIA